MASQAPPPSGPPARELRTLVSHPELVSGHSFPVFRALEERPKGPLERALSLFADVRAGEGIGVLLLTLNVFLLLGLYYLLRSARQALILTEGAPFGWSGSQLAAYSAENFVELILRRCFRLRELLIGYDHGFGRQRAGNVEVLKTLGDRDGFRVEVVDPVSGPDGHSISSTSIRRAIAGGDLHRAAESLGRPYSVSGRVVKGAQRGRTIGFPTLNLGAPPPRKLLPPEGVYAVRAQTPRGPVGGMMNLGPRPTFGDLTTSLEAHLFDTSGDFYGANIRLDFVARIRETRKFASAEQLAKQLGQDERDARNALTLFGVANNLKG
jgi:riboflavin kinase/FMN adenylyltransferase